VRRFGPESGRSAGGITPRRADHCAGVVGQRPGQSDDALIVQRGQAAAVGRTGLQSFPGGTEPHFYDPHTGTLGRFARSVAWRGSQEQPARLLGLSRVTVNRALARLARAGAVELTARGVVISDQRRLDACAAHWAEAITSRACAVARRRTRRQADPVDNERRVRSRAAMMPR